MNMAGTRDPYLDLPLEGVAILLGIDEIMDMARTSTNVLGNCLATAVVARWEGEFNDAGNELSAPADPAVLPHSHPAIDTAKTD